MNEQKNNDNPELTKAFNLLEMSRTKSTSEDLTKEDSGDEMKGMEESY